VFLRIFVCSQSGNHPQEDSAKSGYEVQNFNHPSISLAKHWRFLLCFPHFLGLKTSKITSIPSFQFINLAKFWQ
jgi:hypothetical protein